MGGGGGGGLLTTPTTTPIEMGVVVGVSTLGGSL